MTSSKALQQPNKSPIQSNSATNDKLRPNEPKEEGVKGGQVNKPDHSDPIALVDFLWEHRDD